MPSVGELACPCRASNMGLELVLAIERRYHRKIQKRAVPLTESGSIPNVVPAMFGDQRLHRPAEICCLVERRIDVRIAKDLSPRFQPPIERVCASFCESCLLFSQTIGLP